MNIKWAGMYYETYAILEQREHLDIEEESDLADAAIQQILREWVVL